MISAAFHPLIQDSSPFALTKAIVAGREQTIFRHGAKSLTELFRRASRTGHSSFLITDNTTLTTQDLFVRANAFARLFAMHKISKGMRVALALANDADWIAAFIALTCTGATAVLTTELNPAPQAIATGCAAAVVDRIDPEASSDIAWIDKIGAIGGQTAPFVLSDADPEQEACIAFTSGSSGDPKGVILTHRSMTTGLMNMMLAGACAARSGASLSFPARPVTPAVLLRTPLNHVSGYMQLLLMFLVGGKIVRSKQLDVCSLIAEHQITAVTGISDDEIQSLLRARSEERLRPLRSIAVVGRNLPISLRNAIRETLPSLGLGAGYGLTETNGLVCAIGNADLDARPLAAGPLLPTVECRVIREDGYACESGDSGEIQLRGAMLMRGYCNATELKDGWFSTGDIGYLSRDGYLHVLDKRNRFLCDGDRRISCREIEDAAREATGILDIAALPVRDCAGEQLVVIAAAAAADLDQLRSLLAAKFPVDVIRKAKFVTAGRLPRTNSGKIAYARLLKEVALQ